jgi:hypothetical protein
MRPQFKIERLIEDSRRSRATRERLRRDPDAVPLFLVPEDTSQIPRLRYRTATGIGLLLLAAGFAVAAWSVVTPWSATCRRRSASPAGASGSRGRWRHDVDDLAIGVFLFVVGLAGGVLLLVMRLAGKR